MKVVAIIVIVVAALAGSLPTTAFLFGAAYDLVLSVTFCVYLSGEARQRRSAAAVLTISSAHRESRG